MKRRAAAQGAGEGGVGTGGGASPRVSSSFHEGASGGDSSGAACCDLLFLAEGMKCASCTGRIEAAILKIQGVVSVSASLLTGRIHVKYSSHLRRSSRILGGTVSRDAKDEICDTVSGMGFDCTPLFCSNGSWDMLRAEGGALDSPVSIYSIEILARGPGDSIASSMFAAAATLKSQPGVLEVNISSDGEKPRVLIEVHVRRGPGAGGEGEAATAMTSSGPRDLVDALAERGFAAVPVDQMELGEDKAREAFRREMKKSRRLLTLALILTAPIVVLHLTSMHEGGWLGGIFSHCITGGLTVCEFLMFLMATPIQLVVGGHFCSLAWKRAYYDRSIGMDFLIATATTVAYLFSVSVLAVKVFFAEDFSVPCSFETSALLLTSICVGRYLEARARRRTTSAISLLLKNRPKGALLVVGANSESYSLMRESWSGGKGSDRRQRKELGQLPTRWIPSGLLQVADILRVSPGCRVPCDGVIVDGMSYLDESMMTGESNPVCRTVGDSVFGGTVNQLGVLHIQATDVGEDSALGKIIALVDAAASFKPPVKTFADRLAAFFAPTVLLISISVFVAWYVVLSTRPEGGSNWPIPDSEVDPLAFSLLTAVAVLVVACPCALGLATPTATLVGSGVGASQGLLIKGAPVFEAADGIMGVIFDKTGTLTEGQCEVMDVLAFEFGREDVTLTSSRCLAPSSTTPDCEHPSQLTLQNNLLMLAATAESLSEHPFGIAIVRTAAKRGLEESRFGAVSEWEYVPGKGVKCQVGNLGSVALGSRAWVKEEGVTEPDGDRLLAFVGGADAEGWSTVFVSINGVMKGCIALGDRVRVEAKEAVYALQSMGLEVGLMTGDSAAAALAVARHVGIPANRVMASLGPEGKADAIKVLQDAGASVAFAGDGLNDGPALMRANVGIAVGAGADVAIAAADVVLLRSNLQDVVAALDLSHAVYRRIQLNFAWALGYNVVAIPLAAGAFLPSLGLSLSPEIAALFMAFSSISVLVSSLLLGLYRRPGQKRWEVIRSRLQGLVATTKKWRGCEASKSRRYHARQRAAIPWYQRWGIFRTRAGQTESNLERLPLLPH